MLFQSGHSVSVGKSAKQAYFDQIFEYCTKHSKSSWVGIWHLDLKELDNVASP